MAQHLQFGFIRSKIHFLQQAKWGVLFVWMAGCGSANDSALEGIGLGGSGHSRAIYKKGNPCQLPNDECPCDEPGETVDCGTVERYTEEYLSCSLGERTCGDDSRWGACIGDRISLLPVPKVGPQPQGFGDPAVCTTNPCDPYCNATIDTSSGLTPLPPGFTSGDNGLTISTDGATEGGGGCSALVLTPDPATLTVTQLDLADATSGGGGGGGGGPLPSAGSGNLYGEYFNQIDVSVPSIPSTWTPTGERRDQNIDFTWSSSGGWGWPKSATGPAVAGIGSDYFSIRWTGQLVADATDNFQIHTISDDGIRVWLDDTLIIDRWNYQGPTEVISSQVWLTAGQAYDIRVEYFEATQGAVVELYWSNWWRWKTIIPPSAFLPPLVGGGSGSGSGTGGSGGAESEGPSITDPASITFTAALEPEGCFDGTFEPAWTLSRFDAATISDTGKLKAFAAVSQSLEVRAYAGNLVGTAEVRLNVDILDDSSAPSGSVAAFETAGSGSGTDPATVLYPYDNTILPLGLRPPLIQYDNGGSGASATKITLRYPASGTPEFEWASIASESSPPRIEIPSAAWKAFEQTAKGDDALIVLQRRVGATVYEEIPRTIRFADAALRGNIYYTEYKRGGDSFLRIADPGSTELAQDAFAGITPAGSGAGTLYDCPVCHSVSAQGNVLVTSDRTWGLNGGISRIEESGIATSISDHPGDAKYKEDSEDWRGFAWAPLNPDGKYILNANNVWGNSTNAIVGIDKNTDTIDVPDRMLSGSNGTGLFAEYFSDGSWGGNRWAMHVPHVDFDFNAGGPGGPIGSNFTARYSGQMMAYFDEDYTLSVTSTGGVRLTVDGNILIDQLSYSGSARTLTATLPLMAGEKSAIVVEWKDTTSDAELSFNWESARTPFARVPVFQLFPNNGVHGVLAEFYDAPNFSNLISTSLEPNVNVDFGSLSPPGVSADNFSTTFQGQLEAPQSGNIQLCVRGSDNIEVEFDGSTVLSFTGTDDMCSGNLNVTEGSLYPLSVSHRDYSGNAYVQLSWQSSSFARTPISGAYLYPPSGYVQPASGLMVSYYDDELYESGQGRNPTAPGAMTTFVDDVDVAWQDGRPNYSILTHNDRFSARYTGQITFGCDGIYEFESIADDKASLFVDNQRLLVREEFGTATGAAYFTAGTYDIKYDVQEATSWSSAQLNWIPHCDGATSFVTIPSNVLSPFAASTSAGFIRAGGDNTGSVGYFVWETPEASGAPPVDVTAETAGRWGLGSTTMMVPSFAPDGTKLVFIDGDQGGGAGWRKGLSIFDFSQEDKYFSNRRNVVNNWPAGYVMRWPVFESDSRTLLYQTSTPVDWCCKVSAIQPFWHIYGHMSPLNYFETPGSLWTVDSEASTPVPVELKILNEGERPMDANKVFQPTMLPEPAAGYRWAVFTSIRPYGNVLNQPNVQNDYSDPENYSPMVYNNSNLQSMLWVAAIDDEVSGDTDRSHPAFFLPNQRYAESASTGYVNERGFWALDGCREVGTGGESECEVNEDCCGGSGSDSTAVCRLDTPVSSPPTRHCQTRPAASSCIANGDGCGESSDCCLGSVCVGAVCQAPPSLGSIGPVNFTRVFESDCERSDGVIWRFFDWQAETPGDSSIEFYAESAEDEDSFEDLPTAPNAVESTNLVGVGSVSGGTISGWVGNNVGTQLDDATLPHREYLKVTMRFVPGTDGVSMPLLKQWRQSYDCIPDQ